MKKIHAYKEKTNSHSFARGINFYKLVWIFVIGCMIGYLVETLWCFISLGYIESRQGVIYGPFSPVYGFGAVLFTIFLDRFREKNGVLIFSLSALLGGIFEYICSWLQELSLGTVSWEYSSKPFNFGGRTSLQFAIIWGLLGYFFIRYIYPFISTWVERTPNGIGIVLTWSIFALLATDMIISVAAVKRQTDRLNGIEASNSFSKFMDEHYNDNFLKKIYPNMISAK